MKRPSKQSYVEDLKDYARRFKDDERYKMLLIRYSPMLLGFYETIEIKRNPKKKRKARR